MTQGAYSFSKPLVAFIEEAPYGKNERGTDHYPNLLLKKKNLFTIDPGLELARLLDKSSFPLYTYSLSVLDDGASKKFCFHLTIRCHQRGKARNS